MVEKMKNQPGISLFRYVHEQIQALNNSKVFAGIMIITLNIVSRFVNIKLSKTMESYLKYTFSKYVLVFTIAWMDEEIAKAKKVLEKAKEQMKTKDIELESYKI